MNRYDLLFETKIGRFVVLPWIVPILIGPGLIVGDYNELDIAYGIFHTVLIIMLVLIGYAKGGMVGLLGSWLVLGYLLVIVFD